MLVGAMCIAFSGILVKYSGVSPSTAATFRALYAVPVLAILAIAEDRRLGSRPWRVRGWAFLAGVFFAIDLTFFHHAIVLVGAGLATVMGNLQVLFVGVVAWLFLGERPRRTLLAAVPVALVGVVLISGVVGAGAYGSDPGLGAVFGLLTAASYSGYLLLIRHGRELRRVAGPILDASIACAVTAAIGGLIVGDLDLVPSFPAHAWLVVLAMSAQVGGLLLIAIALPRLPAITTSLLLLSQPVMSVFLAMVLVSEAPSVLQLLGVALVIGGVAFGTLPQERLRRAAGGMRRSSTISTP